MKEILLLALTLLSLPLLAEERFRAFNEGKTHSLQISWENETATIEVFPADNSTNALWTNSFPLPANDRFSVRASLSDDGEVAIVEPGIRSLSQSNPAALIFFRGGKLVRQYAGGYIASQISDSTNSYAKDFLSRLEASGAIRFFDQSPKPNLFCLWTGQTDRWLVLHLATGDILKASPAQEAEWNRRCRERFLRMLNGVSSGDPAAFAQNNRVFHPTVTAPGQPDLSAFRHNSAANILKFLTRRHFPEDEVWLKSLLSAPAFGGGYSGRQHSAWGPVYTGVTALSLSGGSQIRRLGELLLTRWNDGWSAVPEDATEWNYSREAGSKYFGKAKMRLVLPRDPTTNDGVVQITLSLISGTNPPSISSFQWDMKTAIDLARYVAPRETNAPVEPISNVLDIDLREIVPGNYSVEALWARSRQKLAKNAVAEPGDYLETNRNIQITVGEKADIEIFCTNQIAGYDQLYANDLKGRTNHAPVRLESTQPAVISAKGRGDETTIAEQTPNNLSLGKLSVKKISYGRLHKFLDHEERTDENTLAVWFEGATESTLYSYELFGRRGEKFRDFCRAGSSSDGRRDFTWVIFNNWPRRHKTFALRATTLEGSKIGEVELPNPAHATFVEFIPQRFPVTTNIGALVITFKGLSSDLMYQPDIQLTERGKSATEWEIGATYFEDCTGNRSGAFEELLHENAIRYKVDVYRTPLGTFSQDEVWRIPLSIPPPGEFASLTHARTMQGVSIQLVAVAGIGEISYVGETPTKAIPTVDPSATAYNPSLCSWGTQSKPDVFVRGTGVDWNQFHRNPYQKDEFSVIGSKPHLALRLTGVTPQHRVYLDSEQVYINELHLFDRSNTATTRGGVMFLPLNTKAGPGTVTITVQKCETAAFIVKVPAAARLKRTLEKVPFLRD